MTTKSVKKYKLRKGFRVKGDPKEIGKVLGNLEDKYGNLAPKIVEKEARKKSSPLHSQFEWNDKKAALEYRLDQARYLIRSFSYDIVINEVKVEIPVYTSLKPKEVHGPYTNTLKVLSNEEKRAVFIRDALNALNSWRSQYSGLEEFTELYSVIDKYLR